MLARWGVTLKVLHCNGCIAKLPRNHIAIPGQHLKAGNEGIAFR
jgi:hypothetical protein